MKDIVKVWIISGVMSVAPLSASDSSLSNQNNIEEKIASEIGSVINNFDIVGVDDKEIKDQNGNINTISYWINARIVTDAALSYFDEEVRLYDLKWEPREKVESTLMKYLSKHPILRVTKDGDLIFVIDDKNAFSSMLKELADAILSGMSPLMRGIAITIAFWWNSWLEAKFSDLNKTLMEARAIEFKNIVFDYAWWIFKRVAKSVNWKMTIKWYYDYVTSYYPNKNGSRILDELNASGQANNDIKTLEYPFNRKK